MRWLGTSAKWRAALIASTALLPLTLAGAADAQTTSPSGPSAGSTQPKEIIVTGSRILRRDFTSDSPIVTMTSQNLTNTSQVSVDQQLDKLPQFGASANNQTYSAGDVQSTPTNSPGIATVNLRGLGANRTLVLLDGRRMQPANASLVVDLNTIPTDAIDNVEVITGGAAATYGADAVAGVVNFKLKKDFQGVTLNAQYGLSGHGDGSQTKISALLGGNFGHDRGNALLAISYSNRSAVYARNRTFYSKAYTDPNTGSGFFINFPGFYPFAGSGPATQAAVDQVFSSYGYPAGDVSNFSTIYFNTAATTSGATLFSATHGAVSGQPTPNFKGPFAPYSKITSSGDLTTNTINNFISLPLKRYSMFGKTRYKVNDHVTFYAQANFDQNYTQTRFASVPALNQWSVTVPYVPQTDSPVLFGTSNTPNPNFIPAGQPGAQHPVPKDLAILLNSRAGGSNTTDLPWAFNNVLTYLGDDGLNTTTNTYQVLGGAKGDIGFSDWTYDLYWSHGMTYQTNDYVGFADLARYQTLMNLPDYGKVTNAVTGPLTNFEFGRAASCSTGLNPFVNTAISQDCKNIIRANLKNTTDIVQDQVELDIQGRLVDAPAGEVRFAAGADWRNDQFKYNPDTNLTTNAIASTTIGLFDTTATAGSVGVSEGYGELLVPLLKNLPFVQSLNLDAGYRYSSYNTKTGGVNTWKATADWNINQWVMLRGGYQLANRAPNVAELFQPPTFVVVAWPGGDPCSVLTPSPFGNVASNPNRAKVQALCTALSGGFSIGNSYLGNVPFYFPYGRDQQTGNQDLKPEKANTWTLGTVLKSPLKYPGLNRLTLSIDYYNIAIDGAIAVKGTSDIYQECFNAQGQNPTYDPNFPACQDIIRSSANGHWLATIAKYANIGMIATSGMDAELDWNADLPNFVSVPGSAFANITFNYLNSYDIQNQKGGTIFHYADSSSTSVGGAQFRWKLYTTVGVNLGPATVSLSWRHLPSVRNVALVTNPTSKIKPTDSYDLFDLSARWDINKTYELRAGIDNLFDTDPPRVGIDPGITDAAGITDPSSYDVIGRQFYFGAKLRF